MIKAVVFDLDDTIFSEFEYVKSGFKAAADKIAEVYNTVHVYERLWQLFNEKKQGVFDRFLEENNFDKFSVSDLHNIYISHIPKIEVFSDYHEFIKHLKNAGKKTGIITDGRVVSQSAKIEALGIKNDFDSIIITDALGGISFRKPNPKAFEIMADSFECGFNEMIYIGDNPGKDFAISKTYPVKTVRIIRNGLYNNKEYLFDIKPDLIVESLSDIRLRQLIYL